MSRIIKFRGYNQAFGDSSMVYFKSFTQIDKTIEDSKPNANWVIMQFTGLLDKSGKEIWEGDVLERKNVKMEVVFKNGSFLVKWFNSWKANVHKPSICYKPLSWAVETSMVIGDIYSNPSLLKD